MRVQISNRNETNCFFFFCFISRNKINTVFLFDFPSVPSGLWPARYLLIETDNKEMQTSHLVRGVRPGYGLMITDVLQLISNLTSF